MGKESKSSFFSISVSYNSLNLLRAYGLNEMAFRVFLLTETSIYPQARFCSPPLALIFQINVGATITVAEYPIVSIAILDKRKAECRSS